MPETIGGYRILGEIGSGGFGAVNRARDPLNDRDVALKVLTDSNDLERFRREARLAYEIDHPNIIRIFHYGEDGGAYFIVMELMPVSLGEILENGSLSLSRSVDICRQAALGLRAAHERGVVHRDIKPDNILIDSNGTVKVSDFGIAHADDLPDLWIGAGRYMSPEQWKGKRVDVRSDIYSLGVILHEMLIGETPFVIAGGVPSVKWIRPSVPTGLERIFEKCTELDPKRRYQTMDELIESISLELINRCALIDLYEATDGDGWYFGDNWLTDAPLGDWDGVTANRDGVVVELQIIAEFNLDGSIPPEIGNLTFLESLEIYGHHLSGSIPPEIGNLTKLRKLDLSDNRLSGSIPPEMGNLTELEWLHINDNGLSGSIPLEIGNLTKLEWLNLSNNRLSGNIPSEIGNLAKLRNLHLDYNPGSGALSGNRLSGSIPPEMGNLTELINLSLSGNRLSGSIPPEMGNLAELMSLGISDNRLSGSIPPEMGNLTKLRHLALHDNRLSGSIPFEIGGLTELSTLYIGGNNWTGCIPRALFDISANDLDEIDLPVCDG